jgi:hypothetical protein
MTTTTSVHQLEEDRVTAVSKGDLVLTRAQAALLTLILILLRHHHLQPLESTGPVL